MPTNFGLAHVALPTGAGTIDITPDAIGSQVPHGAFLWGTRSAATGTASEDASFFLGALSGAGEEWTMASVSEDASASADETQTFRTDNHTVILNASGSRVDGLLATSTFIAGGVRSTINNSFGSAWIINALVLAGSGSAVAGVTTLNTTEDGSVDITTLGSRPTVCFFGNIKQVSAVATPGPYHHMGIGVIVDDGNDTQRAMAQSEDDAAPSGAPVMHMAHDRVALSIDETNGAVEWAVEAEIISTGVRLYSRGGSPGATDEIGYFMADLDGLVAWLDTVDSPTSTGDYYTPPQADPGMGLVPELSMLFMSFVQTTGTAVTGADAGAFAIGAATESLQGVSSIAIEDAAPTTDTQCLFDIRPVNVPTDEGGTGFVGDFTDFNDNRVRYNFSNVDGTARKWFALGIGEAAAAESSSIVPILLSDRIRRANF